MNCIGRGQCYFTKKTRRAETLLFHGTGGQLGNSGQDAHELFAGDGFFLVQVLGDLVQLAAVFNQHLFGFFMLLLDDFHDLIVHDYGPGRVMASVHAEVPDNADIVKIHELIDSLEKKVESEMGIHIVIHMDPISVNCEKTQNVKQTVISAVKDIDERLNIHDFRMTDGENNINLIFDIEVPVDFNGADSLPSQINSVLKKKDPRFNAVINMDTVY